MSPETVSIATIPYDETVDFIVRRNDLLDSLIAQQPSILYTRPIGDRFVIVHTRQEDFETTIAALGVNFITSAPYILGTQALQTLESSGIVQVQRQPYLDLKGRGVLIGFVDTGIDYTLDTFKYEDGTSKIQYIFDQTIDGNPPQGIYNRGSEFTNQQINEALASDDPYSIVPSRDTDGHGTFLASVAAGRAVGGFIGAAPDSEIIAVKLIKAREYYLRRNAIPDWQENAFESTSIMVGIDYILQKAEELNRPVILCVGLGTNIGTHDGYSIFEEYLASVANLPGVCLCTAAGNESQARHHTQGVIATAGESNDIDIRVGNDAGDIIIAIWNGVSDRMSVSVRSPTGELLPRIPARNNLSVTTPLILENALINIEYHYPLDGSGNQLTIVRLINATPGIWTITIFGDIILSGTYHAWLPIRGFVSPTVEFLSSSPYYTITIPGTMFGSICVGAYNSVFNSLYSETSWGPSRNLTAAPDLVAPGVGVEGFYPFGYGTMDGTSVATALTCGACALMMQWGIVKGNDRLLSTFQIRAYLIRGCNRESAMVYPNEQWGYGSLNLLQSFSLMREV